MFFKIFSNIRAFCIIVGNIHFPICNFKIFSNYRVVCKIVCNTHSPLCTFKIFSNFRAFYKVVCNIHSPLCILKNFSNFRAFCKIVCNLYSPLIALYFFTFQGIFVKKSATYSLPQDSELYRPAKNHFMSNSRHTHFNSTYLVKVSFLTSIAVCILVDYILCFRNSKRDVLMPIFLL